MFINSLRVSEKQKLIKLTSRLWIPIGRFTEKKSECFTVMFNECREKQHNKHFCHLQSLYFLPLADKFHFTVI